MQTETRVVNFTEYGDPTGSPLFYFHGLPGSRLEASISDKIANKSGIRVISIDRPGMGESPFVPNRKILDFASDVAKVADDLGVSKFGVLGHSGGGPYALACAYKIPERISGVGLVSSMVPLTAETTSAFSNGLGIVFKSADNESRYYLVLSILSRVPGLLGYLQRRALDPADLDILALPTVQDMMNRNHKEARKHGMRGRALETYLLTQPWGFNLGDISIPVQIWHGARDRAIPVQTAKYLQKRLPKSEIHIYPDEGHYIMFKHTEEIVTLFSTCQKTQEG